MTKSAAPGFGELASRLHEATRTGFVDLYCTRTAEVWWRLDEGRVVGRRSLLREGAAARFAGSFRSSDGLDRMVLAELLAVPARTLPAFELSAFPTAPELDGALSFAAGARELHWRGDRAAVLTGGRAVTIRRPELLEITLGDGQRFLYSWPLAAGLEPPAPPPSDGARVHPGRTAVLLAPAAAAVLFHELLAHPLEGDLLLSGASPLARHRGERIFSVALDADDDPTAADLPGSFSADDEGVEARRRPLLRNGVVVGALCDRSSATALAARPGNARRATVHTPPRPRVSNLIVHAGDGDPDALRREATVEVTSLAAGALEPRVGLVTLAVRAAWLLRHGRRSRSLAPFTLACTLADALAGVRTAVGPSRPSAEPGWCRKDGEIVAVGGAAPWVLLAGVEAR